IPDVAVEIKSTANKVHRLFLGEVPADFARTGSAYLVQRLLFQLINNDFPYSGRQKFPILILVVDHRTGLVKSPCRKLPRAAPAVALLRLADRRDGEVPPREARSCRRPVRDRLEKNTLPG